MKLTNPTDDELDEAFDVHVAEPFSFKGIVERCGLKMTTPEYCRSMDAVLPWLQKWYCQINYYAGAEGARPGWRVIIEMNPMDKRQGGECFDQSLARAVVITLLRAHGVEIEFK